MPARLKFLPASPTTLECFAQAPGNFAGRLQEDRRSMDAFSEVLSGVRLKGAMFFSAEFSAPWRLSTPHCRVLAPTLAPGAPHIVVYHFVVEGTARARVEGGLDVELSPGDIVVFPHGDPHHLSAGPGTNPVESAAVLQRITTGDLSPMQAGGGGAITRFVCGYLSLDPLLCGPILESLPPILKVNVRTDRAGQWLEQSILHLLEEAASDRAGSDAMLAKLSEALFVDTVRRYVAGLSDQTTGWLAGARDPVVGKSLALLHRRPEHPWTIAELATTVGVSRSALVARFTRYLSDPPMAYLTGWRLRLAAQALTSSAKGVADVAAAVGYESEAAFNRAFKRAFGVPPARYRRETRKAASSRESPMLPA
jgi:AraC-like DNA-binding protein